MMWLHPHDPLFPEIHPRPNQKHYPHGNALAIACAAAAVMLTASLAPGFSAEALATPQAPSTLNSQVMGDGIRINVDGFNMERERTIAQDSEKLLSLAVALKAELDHPGPLSSDEIRKAKEIEKLAKHVKDKMRFNPDLEPIPIR